MRKVNYTPYVFLGILFLLFFSVPKFFNSCIRPIAQSIVPLKKTKPNIDQAEVLAAENQRLRSQLQAVDEWLLFDERYDKQVDLFTTLCSKEEKDPLLREFFQRRAEELSALLQKKLFSLPAQVVLREPISWSSCLWINIGNKQNKSLGKLIVAKNSPVIKGNTLIGVVEEVLKDRSRVRLITDSALIPSVRAVRGSRQDFEVAQQINTLIDRIKAQEHLFVDEKEKESFLSSLFNLKSRLYLSKEDLYLAKGELHGSLSISNRTKSPLLKGLGFNYAFADQEGKGDQIKVPLIQSGDLLVTTGLDGIFPKDLDVAIVTKVHPLKPEDCTYQIEAQSTVGNLDDLSTLYVLPPKEFVSFD